MKKLTSVILAMVFFAASPCFGMVGDLNNSNQIDLQDAVMVLQGVAGIRNLDSKIGIGDAIYALKILAGFQAVTGKAILGPLAGATVNAYRLKDLKTSISTAQTDADGNFTLAIGGVKDDEYLLIAVTGGNDTDADDDGVKDAAPTPNSGTVHALAKYSDIKTGSFNVTAISDIAWQYTKNLVNEADASGLAIRLRDLAIHFFGQNADINGDGAVDGKDICAFNPLSVIHKSKLNFDYQTLFVQNADGNSVIGCYHRNLPDVLPELLDNAFGSRLTLYPTTDVRYEKVKFSLAVFGRGTVVSDKGGISYDSERQNPAENVTAAFLNQSGAEKITLTAAPTADTEILSWTGCDTVSEDKTRCECNLAADRQASVTFGYKEGALRNGVTLIDMSNAQVGISADLITLDVTASSDDSDLIAKLAALKAGDFVVGSAGSGFLRKVVSFQKQSDAHYILTTDDASIGDVVARGTGGFYKRMTQADIEGYERRSLRSGIPPAGVQTPDGVRLVLSDDPDDSVFKIEIGDLQKRSSTEGELKWQDPKTGKFVSLKGTVEFTIDFDKGVSYDFWRDGLDGPEYLKLIMIMTAKQSLELSVGGEVELPEDMKDKLKIPLAIIPFGTIPFQIGPLPVWIQPEVEIFLQIAEIKASGQLVTGFELKQTAQAGIVYNRNTGAEIVTDFSKSSEFTPPTAQLYAEAKSYVQAEAKTKVYSVTGPVIFSKGYFKVKAEREKTVFKNEVCTGGIEFTVHGGVEAGFKWDLGKARKLFGSWAKNIEAELDLFKKEWLLKKWNVLGTCDNTPPFMEVDGFHVDAVITKNSGAVIRYPYTVRNTGDLKMDWEVRLYDDAAIEVTPKSGSLEKGQSAVVNMTITGDLLNLGEYANELKFINKYDGGLFSAEAGGSTTRMVVVVVTPDLAAPVMNTPQLAIGSNGKAIPSIVNLSWNYTQNLNDVHGFIIYMTKTPDIPDSWQRTAVVANRYAKSGQISGLQTNTRYYFRMAAYGLNMGTNLSNIVSVFTSSGSTAGDYTNSLGMSFNLIPAGTFTMGSPADEPGRDSDETQHQVTLTRSFYMQTTEVTQGQWKAVMGSNPSRFIACGDNCPVERVSWEDIQGFITKMNQRGEGIYRLPTEAEWEYAARAGSTTAFYNGAITNIYSDPNLDLIGWYWGNSTVTYTPIASGKGTHPVAQKQPNAWGLYDMAGNVYEWCSDWYEYYYPTTAVTDPAGPSTGSYRVLRGGSWPYNARDCRSAERDNGYPSGRYFNGFGFRLVRSLGQQK